MHGVAGPNNNVARLLDSFDVPREIFVDLQRVEKSKVTTISEKGRGSEKEREKEREILDKCTATLSKANYLINTIAGNKGDLARPLIGVENIQQVDQLIWPHAGPALDSDRVLDSSKVLDVGSIQLSCAVSDPDKVSSDVVVLLLRRICGVGHQTGQGLLVLQQQTLVRRKDIDGVECTRR